MDAVPVAQRGLTHEGDPQPTLDSPLVAAMRKNLHSNDRIVAATEYERAGTNDVKQMFTAIKQGDPQQVTWANTADSQGKDTDMVPNGNDRKSSLSKKRITMASSEERPLFRPALQCANDDNVEGFCKEQPEESEHGDVVKMNTSMPELTLKGEEEDTEDLSKPSGPSFPSHLMALLDRGAGRSAMWWMPDGRSFCLLPKNCGSTFMDLHFSGNKFESLTRKLNRWGFKRLVHNEAPPDAFVFRHPLFLRGQPELLKRMSGGTGKLLAKSMLSIKETSYATRIERTRSEMTSSLGEVPHLAPSVGSTSQILLIKECHDQQSKSPPRPEGLLTRVMRSTQALETLQILAQSTNTLGSSIRAFPGPESLGFNSVAKTGPNAVDSIVAAALRRKRENELVALYRRYNGMRDDLLTMATLDDRKDAAMNLLAAQQQDVICQRGAMQSLITSIRGNAGSSPTTFQQLYQDVAVSNTIVGGIRGAQGQSTASSFPMTLLAAERNSVLTNRLMARVEPARPFSRNKETQLPLMISPHVISLEHEELQRRVEHALRNAHQPTRQFFSGL